MEHTSTSVEVIKGVVDRLREADSAFTLSDPYRAAPLQPDSPDYNERLKSTKLRPFVSGQTVLVRLTDVRGSQPKPGPWFTAPFPQPGPWFTATFTGFSENGGFTFIRLKSGDALTDSFLQCQTEMLHLEPGTNATEGLPHED